MLPKGFKGVIIALIFLFFLLPSILKVAVLTIDSTNNPSVENIEK